jgi:hypothetical protein
MLLCEALIWPEAFRQNRVISYDRNSDIDRYLYEGGRKYNNEEENKTIEDTSNKRKLFILFLFLVEVFILKVMLS